MSVVSETIRIAARLAFGFALLCAPAAAQSTSGTVLVTVSDTSGAVIKGAELVLKDMGRDIPLRALSDSLGAYEFLNLTPGNYELTGAKNGMSIECRRFPLAARQAVRIDLTLVVAARSERIEISSGVSLLNTENGTISDTKNFEQISRLPMNYRASNGGVSIFGLPSVPGNTGDDLTVNNVLNGAFVNQRTYTVDGIAAMNNRFNSPQYFAPSTEMLSEMKVSSINNTPEFGPIGDVTVISKSGTNRVRGSASWYHQNAALDAKIYRSPTKQQKVFNDFAAALGGPVLIPHLYDGHNRTFFFADYEGQRFPRGWLYSGFVPAPAWRAGDLAGLPGGAAADPNGGLPFPGNRIPASRISAVSRTLLDQYVPPPTTSTPMADPNYLVLTRGDAFNNQYDVRLDQMIGSKQFVFGRWSHFRGKTKVAYNPLPLTGEVAGRVKHLVLAHTITPRPNISNEFRFGYSDQTYSDAFPLSGADVIANLGLRGLDLSSVGAAAGFPYFDFSDATDFSPFGHGREWYQDNRNHQVTDTLTWTLGRHTLRGGGDIRRIRAHFVKNVSSGDDFGTFQFLSGTMSGNAFVNFLLGVPTVSTTANVGRNPDLSGIETAAFLQDTYKVSRKLTLSFGLRWEVHPPIREATGNLTNFDHVTGAVIIPDHTISAAPGFLATINACPGAAATMRCTPVVTASQVGLPGTLRQTYWRDWLPRAGFAWRPFGARTVVRGGAGIYTQSLLASVGVAMTGLHSSDVRRYTNTLGNSGPLFAFPDVAAGAPLLPLAGIARLAGSGVDTTLHDPHSYQWNLTLERELGWNMVTRATYHGLQSTGIPMQADYNQLPTSTVPFTASRRPYPAWSSLLSLEALGFANYQSFQLAVERRFRHDLFFQASYTVAKDLTNVAGGASANVCLSGPGTGIRTVTDRFNTRMDRGNLPAFRRQNLILSGLFPLPVGKGRAFGGNWRGWRNGALGGWEVSTITTAGSGPHQTVLMPAGWDQSNTDITSRGVAARPDRVGSGSLAGPMPERFYDITAFTAPSKGVGRFGNAGAGTLTGPGLFSAAAGISKTLPITERLHIRMEATFTNILNHPNFLRPDGNIGSPAFGQPLFTAGQRSGQFGARFDW